MTNPSDSGALRRLVHLPLGLLAGATYPLRALVLLQKTPQLWGNVLLPILVNLVLGGFLYVELLLPGWTTLQSWSTGLPVEIQQWLAGLPTWLSPWLGWLPVGVTVVDDILRWLLAIALFIAIGFLLVQFGAILGAPWYGNLAEQIEHLQMGELPIAQASLGRAMQDIWRAIAFQLKKLILLAIGAVPLLLLNLIPGLGNAISSIGWVTLAALLIGLDFLDPPLERRRLKFRGKLGLVGRTFPASVSFAERL